MKNSNQKTAIIIGAGPAGITAAHELIKKTNIKPIIYEIENEVGGIARTINFKGNRMDLGPHRFFSKSDQIVQWWKDILPPAEINNNSDKSLLTVKRITHIFFLKKFFDYPVELNYQTFSNLGPIRLIKIALSYFKIKIFPIREEKSLEDFFTNRFGRELYLTFFKDYTEKLWGLPCSQIDPSWGSQRVKGLSITKTIADSAAKILKRKDIKTETSLIRQFMYPKLGSGQMWQEAANEILKNGGEIHLNSKIVGLEILENRAVKCVVKNLLTGETKTQSADYFFSAMPIKELIEIIGPKAPKEVLSTAKGLKYRSFVAVGLSLKKLNKKFPDNWIYIQEPGLKMGRIQIFNNWSPRLASSPNTTLIGVDYFCDEGDQFWNNSDNEIVKFAVSELLKINFIEPEDVLDSVVIKTKKAYPAYFGSYQDFDKIRKFTDSIENLFLIGRNGMHKYNNMDHSMLTAMAAVDNILKNSVSKANIWEINTEEEYHEQKS